MARDRSLTHVTGKDLIFIEDKMEPTSCPNCGASFQGEEIPEKYRKHYGEHTHYSRCIGIYSVDRDRVIQWLCPDCNYQWERTEMLSSTLRRHNVVAGR